MCRKLEHKNVESITCLHDQGREPFQPFTGQSPWGVAWHA